MNRIALHISGLMVSALLTGAASAATMGDDGLHKAVWMEETFLDMAEDLETANDEGKRLLVIFEQRGCIYCKKMHEDIFPIPEIEAMLEDDFYVVQMNLFGDLEVTDFDGEVLPEKDMARKWGVMFTPTMFFLPETVEEGKNAGEVAVAKMPGAFGRGTTLNLLRYVKEKAYDTGEHFQKYLARNLQN